MTAKKMEGSGRKFWPFLFLGQFADIIFGNAKLGAWS
jgi:hypothetical protein